MQCPKCEGPMLRVSVQGYEVDRCERCGGLWFDLREHEHLARAARNTRIDTGDPAKGREMNTTRDILCPRDHSTLIPMSVLGQPHIQIERCNVCGGSFFDAGEFRDYKEITAAEWLRYLMPGRG